MSNLVMEWNDIRVGTLIHNDNGEDYVVLAINPKCDRVLLVKNATKNPFYVGAWALQRCKNSIAFYWGQGHYFMDNLEAAIDYVMDISQKVYTVQYQVKYDYDFSVETTNHGCFKSKEDAIDVLSKVVAKVKANHEDDMEEYSDKEIYPDEDDGALYIEEENDVFYMTFGYQEHHEVHTVWIDEWEVK